VVPKEYTRQHYLSVGLVVNVLFIAVSIEICSDVEDKLMRGAGGAYDSAGA
jgi:hypothetical protein